jgi:hypothetical protein
VAVGDPCRLFFSVSTSTADPGGQALSKGSASGHRVPRSGGPMVGDQDTWNSGLCTRGPGDVPGPPNRLARPGGDCQATKSAISERLGARRGPQPPCRCVVIGRTDLHGHLLDAANGRSLIGARVSADYLEAQPAEVRLLFPRDLLERFSSDLPTARLQSGNAFSNAFHSAIGSVARRFK